MTTATAIFFVLGLLLLIGGAEFLVRGASSLATALGMSPMVVGLTVVSLCTTAPEFAVSIQAAMSGRAELCVGNVVGSSIFNVLFILGMSAMLEPVKVTPRLLKIDGPVFLAVILAVWFFSSDGMIAREEGLFLLGGQIVFMLVILLLSKRQRPDPHAELLPTQPIKPRGSLIAKDAGLMLAGLFALALGSRWLVDAATEVAKSLGVSELMIGLTIVAMGTSLPETATSVIAWLRGKRELSVGNILGASILNLMGNLGLTAAIAGSIAVPAASLQVDFPVLTVEAVACLVLFFTGSVIARWEGGLMMLGYFTYLAYLVLEAVDPKDVPMFRVFVLVLGAPLLLLVLGWSLWRAVRKPQAPIAEGPTMQEQIAPVRNDEPPSQ